MMYPRLYLAQNLLREDGVIYISIGQDEVYNLTTLCNEIFGEENLLTICSRVVKTGGQKGIHFSPSVDYILCYAKNIKSLSSFREEISQNVIDKVYTKIEEEGPRKGERYRSMGLYQAMLDVRANQRYYIECPDGTLVIPPGITFPRVEKEGEQIEPDDVDGVWRWTYNRYMKEKTEGNVEFIKSNQSSLIHPDGSKASWNVYYKIWLKDRIEDGQLPGNILTKFESRHASAELKDLDIPFDFPKPSALVKFLMSITGISKDDIVLDFFAGSCPLSHAAIEYSIDNEQLTHFICVQLPEKTAEDSEEYKSGYKTISDIGKERTRRVIKKMGEVLSAEKKKCRNQLPGMEKEIPVLDLGFKVFKLDRSNFKIWDGSRPDAPEEELIRQLSLHIDHIDPHATQEDILFELLLKAGFTLTEKVQKLEMAGKTVYSAAENVLLICLEDKITRELIDAVVAAEPRQFLCLDKGFQGNDQLKANAVQTFNALNQGRDKTEQIVFRTV